MPTNEPVIILRNAAEWAAWLAREADISNAVRIVLVKKGVTEPTSLTYDDALDEALCHGWIDGTGHRRDETSYVRRFTPRRPNSLWSKRNVGYISRLESEGRMQPRGRLEVERAKADGRWESAYSQANMEAPADLLSAIAAVPDAQAQWDILTKQNKFAICFRLMSLKTETGRQKRLHASVDMLARGETLHPQKQTRESANAPSRVTKPKSIVNPSRRADSSCRRSERIQAASQLG